MDDALGLLLATTAAVAFLHTVVGPDHYLPLIALGEARGWTAGRTLAVTALCGAGHVLGSVALGLAGIALGVALSRLSAVEAARGDLAAWLLIAIGLLYLAWGLRHALRGRHRHVHGTEEPGRGRTAPWLLFLVFVLGPCEPLIPLMMVPAAEGRPGSAAAVAGVFGAVTVGTMVAAVGVGRAGTAFLPWSRLERFRHALAGGAILLCGLGIRLLGL